MMNIVIGYDGSRCADAAIDDLVRAGLPADGNAKIVTVAYVRLPPPESLDEPVGPANIEQIVQVHRERSEKAIAEASELARKAKTRVRAILPGWTITANETYGSPSREILAAAEEVTQTLSSWELRGIPL